ncbi:hypothetical protein EJB05_17229, partial [Eragrostis curvula]
MGSHACQSAIAYKPTSIIIPDYTKTEPTAYTKWAFKEKMGHFMSVVLTPDLEKWTSNTIHGNTRVRA